MSWRQRAACRGTELALFFPGPGEPADLAKAICARCLVWAECREANLGERFGVWGGLSENQRARVRGVSA